MNDCAIQAYVKTPPARKEHSQEIAFSVVAYVGAYADRRQFRRAWGGFGYGQGDADGGSFCDGASSKWLPLRGQPLSCLLIIDMELNGDCVKIVCLHRTGYLDQETWKYRDREIRYFLISKTHPHRYDA